MKIIYMGTPDFAIPTLRSLIASRHEVAAVFTQPDKPKGRGMKLAPPPVKELAMENDIEVFQPTSLKNDAEEYIAKIKEINPDVIVVAAYGKILPKEVLDIPKYGCVNVHGSLLPRYRGAAPIQHAVLNGDEITGITTMLMSEGLDMGDMLLSSRTRIGENETADELFDRLSLLGADLLLRTLEGLEEGSLTPVKQDEAAASYASMLTKDMSEIDFSKTAFEVHKKICGLSGWPCASTKLFGKRLKVYRSEIVDVDTSDIEPGSVIDNKKFIVACKDRAVKLVTVQLEGSKRMNAEDFLRGRKIDKGTILG
ncbi:MAG: methionyl-tRNA formyltransferase [Ruminococcus sp.]|nr:methionyl-tRNA formyltransferase [Ruminococcus sp.]